MELLIVEVPEQYVGPVMEKIGSRKGELENMGTRDGGSTHLEFKIPARGNRLPFGIHDGYQRQRHYEPTIRRL